MLSAPSLPCPSQCWLKLGDLVLGWGTWNVCLPPHSWGLMPSSGSSCNGHCLLLCQAVTEGRWGVPAAMRPAQTCCRIAACQSCFSFVCMEECLLVLFIWCFYLFVGIDVSFLWHGTPVLCCHTKSLRKACIPFGGLRQSPLIGGEIQPGRLGLVLLLCSNKTFEGSLIILRLISIFSWMCLLLYVVKWSIWIVVKFMWIRLGCTQHQLLPK